MNLITTYSRNFIKVLFWIFLLGLSKISLSQDGLLSVEISESTDDVTAIVSLQAESKILGMQFSVNWDPVVLQYANIELLQNFNQRPESTVGISAPKGVLSFLWIGPVLENDNPFDFTNSLPLFKLTFKKRIPVAPFVFVNDDPTIIEIFNYADQILAIQTATNLEGIAITNGKVYWDEDDNCINNDETNLANKIIELINLENGQIQSRITNENGEFWFPVSDGNFAITAINPHQLWAPCEDTLFFAVENLSAPFINLGLKPAKICPKLVIETQIPVLRRCFENDAYIQYRNIGTALAENISIRLKLDPLLTLTQCPFPYVEDGDSVYIQIPDLGINQDSTFRIKLLVDCDHSFLGQTHCFSATIHPHDACGEFQGTWEGSQLAVRTNCENDSVKLELRNIGPGPMNTQTRFIVTEDIVIFLKEDVQLDFQEDFRLDIPATGKTYRLHAVQETGYPGPQDVVAFVEGCGQGNPISKGIPTQFQDYDDVTYYALECVENKGSFDPNDKSAIPKGLGENHEIDSITKLEYLIRFQNIGTDTAFSVIILDTLDPNLDTYTLQVGPSSHQFSFDVNESGILRIIFDQINLADSNTNELESHGFIKVSIRVRSDAEIGTIINNRSAIYFDFNDPILTNTVQHQIAEPLIDIRSFISINKTNPIQVVIVPNPVVNDSYLRLKGDESNDWQNYRFGIYDMQGRMVQHFRADGSHTRYVPLSGMRGIYFIKVYRDRKIQGVGKMIIP